MATYAQNLSEVQQLQGCGAGFVAFVPDPSSDVIVVKDPTPDDECGTTQVFKSYHGGHAVVDLSDEPDSGVA
jgi:hypothetical protein